ncbi:MAG: DUF2157 domain-containing protein [Candidatus Absconditabacterales bacterium]|nr:DUF2157 domain-containing protein [Candidatus Absconditabacterales bacterium]
MSSHALIDELFDQGLLSHDQVLRIKHYLNQRQSSSRSVSLIVSIFGGLLIGAGILLWVSLHWNTLPDRFKTVMIIVIMVICFVGAWRRHVRVQDGLTAGLWIVACCAFGGSIFLQGQMYNLGSDFYHAFGLRFLGIVPLAIVVRMKSLLFACFVLLFVRYVSWLGHYDVIRSVWHLVAMVAGYGMLLVSMKPFLLRWFPDSKGLVHHVLVAIYSFCLPFFMAQVLYGDMTLWFRVDTYRWYAFLFPLLACVCVALPFLFGLSDRFRDLRDWGLFGMFGLLFALGLAFGVRNGGIYSVGLVFVLCCLGLMLWYVHRYHDSVVRGWSFVLLWLLCMIVYIDHFSNAGVISLIGGGCVALGLGWFLQRLNTKMTISSPK